MTIFVRRTEDGPGLISVIYQLVGFLDHVGGSF